MGIPCRTGRPLPYKASGSKFMLGHLAGAWNTCSEKAMGIPWACIEEIKGAPLPHTNALIKWALPALRPFNAISSFFNVPVKLSWIVVNKWSKGLCCWIVASEFRTSTHSRSKKGKVECYRWVFNLMASIGPRLDVDTLWHFWVTYAEL